MSESSTYYAYVRAYINGDTQSNWAGPLSFTTLEQYPTPTDLTVSNYAGVGDRATLSWTNGTGTTPTAWKLRYHTATFNPENNEGSLVEDINSNSYTLTGLTPGQLYYASVLACYDGGNESNWTSLVSFTPIQAWETFENGIPSSWCNQNNNWKTNQSGYEGKAFSSSSGYELRTPRLYATAGQTINFEVTGSPTIKVYRNNSRSSYTSLSGGSTSYTAPSTGYYWLGFSGYNVAIDNIYGFSLASTENLLELGSKNMPTSGTIGGTYTASVEVRELGGNNESFDAELYYDDEKVAEKTSQSISANRDMTIQFSFTPIEEKASKKMYIKIIYNNGESELATVSTNVTMSKTTHILDETGATDNAPSGSLSKGVVWLKYTPRNGWNTICIPFVLTDEHLERIFGTGYEIFKIKSYENGTLTFQKAPSRGISTPYLVYATNANNVDKDNIFLEQSYIGSSNYTSGNMTQQSVFKGIWTTKTYNNDDWYGVTTAGQIRKAASGASVKGYHAYFTGVSAPTGGDARITIVFEDEEGTTTDLGFVKMVDPEAEHIYTLSGQKVQKGKKGIYIVNGRKVVIK
nr:fibronectin type III domain-containing protein [Prevotella sp. E13-27]